MKDNFTLLIANIPACICFLGAICLLATGVTAGWGWLIFAGLMVSITKIKTDSGEKEG